MLQNFTKIILFIVIAIVLTGTLAWLWQRQPRPIQNPQESIAGASESGQTQENLPDELALKIADGTVVNTAKITLEGKTFPSELIAIYSNDFQTIAKSNKNGDFKTEVTLGDGLNLLDVLIITANPDHQKQKSIHLYSANTEAKVVFAGSVKNTFDTLITVNNGTHDNNIRTSKSTNFDIPEYQGEKSAESPVENVRIGDYAIALGNFPENSKDKDTIIAQSLEIIRENKPQNNIRVAQVKIITPVKQNLFSATNQGDKKVLEFTLDKNTDITLNDIDGPLRKSPKANLAISGRSEASKTTDITKDKTAIVFYHQDGDKNLIDLIWLLP